MNEQVYEQLIYQLLTLENSGKFGVIVFEGQVLLKDRFNKNEHFILPSEINPNYYDIRSYNNNNSLYDSTLIKSDIPSLKKAIMLLQKI